MYKQIAMRSKKTRFSSYFFLTALVFYFSHSSLAESLVDPTRPIQQSAKVDGKQSLQLNAILIANKRRQVVINGRHMREGQSASNFKVITIHKNDVVIVYDGKRKVLRLHKTMKKNVSGIAKEKGADVEKNKKAEIVNR